jgi:hypothetical protein
VRARSAEYGSSHRQRGTPGRKSLDEEHIVVPSCADSYDLRHAFVSLLLAEGRSVVYVASQAGHAPSMTLDTYAHVIEELETGERAPADGVIYAARGKLVRTMFARDTEDVPADPAELLICRSSRKALSGTRTLDPLLTMEVLYH